MKSLKKRALLEAKDSNVKMKAFVTNLNSEIENENLDVRKEKR